MCRSGRTSPSGLVACGNGRCRARPGLEAVLRGEKTPLGDQKAVGGDAQAGVVMKTAPAPPFEMAEPDLLLEFAIIALDAPPSLGGGHQLSPRGVLGQGGQPILGRFLFPLGPLDQQPFLGVRFASPIVAMRRPDAHRGKARGQRRVRALAPGDRTPRLNREALGQLQGRDRFVLRIPAPQLGRPAHTAPRFGRQRLLARRPQAERGLHADDIAQPQRSEFRYSVANTPTAESTYAYK